MRFAKVFFLALSLGLLLGCAARGLGETVPATEAPPSQAVTLPETQDPTLPSILDPAAELLRQMTLREKVGQLFLIRPDALDLSLSLEQINDPKGPGVTALSDAMIQALKEYPVGGIVQFGKNLLSPAQIQAFNQALQDVSWIPLFICVDEEGGLISRLANHEAFDLPRYQSAAAVGASGDPADAQEMGRTIGAYLRRFGFNLDFAPVADVNTNPDNPVIGTRAFSSDPETAAQMAAAMAQGLREESVIPVFKHFPGHGNTAEDSHLGLAVNYRQESELRQCEWLPFQAAGAEDLVMVGHIALPNVLDPQTPATLSYDAVTGLLKEELGFQGLVVTDSLSMEAIAAEYAPGDAALAALRAGCELLLMPSSLPDAFDAVVDSVLSGDFPQEELDAIVLRILRFKGAHNLLFSGGVG